MLQLLTVAASDGFDSYDRVSGLVLVSRAACRGRFPALAFLRHDGAFSYHAQPFDPEIDGMVRSSCICS